ncbi:MAG: hypothetical protein IKD71_01290 [Solobacterium sp.]|nr:hypothetical protein [Solobacterium sp.]
MKRQYDDDDGRVIADMSDVRKRNLFLPHTLSRQPGNQQPVIPNTAGSNDDPLQGEEGRWYLFGALRAALLIWLVYAAAFGLFIWLLTFLFRH